MATATKKAKAKAAAPQVGDSVIHHGHLHQITRIGERARMVDGKPVLLRYAVWENDRFLVTGFFDELQWSGRDQAWYLPGRVLARNERALAQAITGSWPAAENHIPVRTMLDAVDLEDVDREKFREVLLRRKADVTEKNVDTYVDAALEQCAALRASRQEG